MNAILSLMTSQNADPGITNYLVVVLGDFCMTETA